MRLSQLVEQWGPPVGGADLDLEQPLGPVTTDSRSLQPGSLFVPLVGERFDGHRFLAQALERGALAAVVERSQLPDVPEGLPAWPVDDTQAAYQLLGTLRRQELAAAVVAVTGSAGKTTTRELLRAALAPWGRSWPVWGMRTTMWACRSPCSRPPAMRRRWWWRWACAARGDRAPQPLRPARHRRDHQHRHGPYRSAR